MPNPNYIAGRRQEYTVKQRMLKSGMICVLRTAGSHGFADLIGIHKCGRVYFVQVKRCKTKAQAKRLVTDFKSQPPLPKGEYVQSITVYVSDLREYVEDTI